MTFVRSARDDRGSAAIEAVIGVPTFMLFVGLIILGGRTATAHQALESAAADGARSASLERTASDAARAAEQAARSSLANQQIHCARVDVEVDSSGFQTAVGRDASVSVSVTCRLDLSDLSIPGVPGTRTLHATVSSPIDTWRERS
ncbi:pilus assembly protein [Nocardioides ginsengisegetis]